MKAIPKVFLLFGCVACSQASQFGEGRSPTTPVKQVADVVVQPAAPIATEAPQEVATPTPTPTLAPPVLVAAPPTPTPTPVPPPLQACSRKGAVDLNLSVPAHWDSGTRADSFDPNLLYSDVMESAVARIDLSSIVGNVLPVSAFGLDDFAMIVKEETQISSVLNLDYGARTRTIQVPPEAVFIYDGNNPQFAGGAVDSRFTTIYRFPSGQEINLPGGISKKLSDFYTTPGLQLIAHNNVSIAELKNRGFVKGDQIVFKVFNIAHGGGSVNLTFHLEPCTF